VRRSARADPYQWGNQVQDPRREVFGTAVARLETESLFREQRRQVLEEDLMSGAVGLAEVDLVDLQKRKIALAILGRTDLAGNAVAGP